MSTQFIIKKIDNIIKKIDKLVLFYFILFYFINGLGIVSQKTTFFLVFLPNLFFIIKTTIIKSKIEFPKEVFFYLLFLLFSIPAAFHNQYNLGISIEGLFFYFNLLSIFIYFFNNKKLGIKFINLVLKLAPIFFILLFTLSILNNNQIVKKMHFSEYNFFFSFYKNHNHLGDLLGLTIIYFFCNYNKKFLIIFFLPFYLLSFSRTAFLAVFICLFIYLFQVFFKKEKIEKRTFFLVVFLISSSSVFFLIKTLQIFYLKNYLIEPRLFYFYYVLKTLIKNPFGIGFYNFGSISAQQPQIGSFSSETHSVFLEILLGGGWLSFVFFLLFVFSCFKKIYKDENKKYFYPLLYLLIVFNFDYVYNIFFFFALFFIFLASAYPKKDKLLELDKKIFIINCFLLFSFFLSFLLSYFYFFQKKPEKAIKFYFLNEDPHVYYINELINKNEINKAFFYIKIYKKLFPKSYDWLASFYGRIAFCEKTIEYSQNALNYYALPYFFRLKSVFYWLNKCVSEDFAYKVIRESYLDKIKKFKEKNDKKVIKNIYKNWCIYDNKNCQKALGEMPFYYQPKKNSIETTNDFIIKATYTLNNEGFNERLDYSIKKPRDAFRILVIGDGNAFGFLVNTKDNWVEKIEDKLNVKNQKSKIEVINLAYHSYDLAYQVERFRQQGIKYKPDLVIWMNNDFFRINEIFLPLTEKYFWLEKDKKQVEQLRKEGKYFPAWERAFEDYKRKVKEEKIDVEGYQKEKIKEFFQIYKGPVIFISLYDIPQYAVEELQNHQHIYIFNPKDFSQNKNFYYEKAKAINPKGHKKLAELIYDFLVSNVLNDTKSVN